MKTLKKTLCLVLALVMALSLMSVASAANLSDYADADEVGAKYAEAVDVLLGLGIVKGISDTEIAPEGYYTRAQAAKIATYLAVGPEVAEMLPAGESFSDVPATHWAAKYIAYCAEKGILNGVSATEYQPEEKVTGYQFAKMVLAAAGYGKNAEFVGNGWAIATAQWALSADIDLFDGDATAATNEPITRQQAMLIAFNAIQNVKFVNFDKDLEAYKAVDEGTKTMKELYGIKEHPTADAFGRPTTIWYIDKDEITGYSATADKTIATIESTPVLTYTAAVTGGKVYTALGKPEAGFTFNRTVNGQPIDDLASKVVSGNSDSFGGNGTVIEIYKTSATSYKAVAIQTFLGTITDHVAAVKDSDGDIVTKEYVTVTIDGTAISGNFNTTAFADSDVVNGTKVLVTATTDGSAWTARSVVAAEAKTLTATSCTATSFVAGGETYKYSENFVGSAVTSTAVTSKTPFIAYVDAYGYVIGTDSVADAAPNYAVLLATATATTLDGTTFSARILKADGTIEDVAAAANYYAYENDIVTYEVNAAGKYVLAQVGETAGDDTAAITKGTVIFEANGAADLKANAKTIFFVKTVSAAGVASYNVYIGISNVPTIESAADSAAYKASGNYYTAVYVDTAVLKAASSTSTDVIFVTETGAYETTDVVKGTYTTYNAIVNGTVTTIEAKAGVLSTGVYTAMTKDANGIVTAATKMATANAATIQASATGTTAAANGVLMIGAAELTYAADAAVYYVAANGAITEAAGVSAIKNDDNDTVVYTTAGGVVTAAYIQVIA